MSVSTTFELLPRLVETTTGPALSVATSFTQPVQLADLHVIRSEIELDPVTIEAAGEDLPECFRSASLRLKEIERLADNWDSYGSPAPSALAVLSAFELLSDLARRWQAESIAGIAPYAVVPVSGGGVQLEWRVDDKAVEIEISAAGDFGYLLITGPQHRRQYKEEDSVARSKVLDLITFVVRG